VGLGPSRRGARLGFGGPGWSRPGCPLVALGALLAGLGAHGAPALAILGSFVRDPPERLLGTRLRSSHGGGVALTFDDGPSPASTPQLLDLLDELGLRATFFLLGCAVRSAPELALEIARRGHEVASHGFHHIRHLAHAPRVVVADMKAGFGELCAIGLRPRFYRPPYGQVAGATHLGARQVGCEIVLWSGWGREFAEHDPKPVLRRLIRASRPGAILLLHDSDAWSPPGTAALARAVLPELAGVLAERNLEALRLGELL
jgi:peptidoglycan/xylan/chitin deacetylase (PgdA/CDA1 family)